MYLNIHQCIFSMWSRGHATELEQRQHHTSWSWGCPGSFGSASILVTALNDLHGHPISATTAKHPKKTSELEAQESRFRFLQRRPLLLLPSACIQPVPHCCQSLSQSRCLLAFSNLDSLTTIIAIPLPDLHQPVQPHLTLSESSSWQQRNTTTLASLSQHVTNMSLTPAPAATGMKKPHPLRTRCTPPRRRNTSNTLPAEHTYRPQTSSRMRKQPAEAWAGWL
ncbi:hypothetical protein BDZ85DRAFT_124960 [Elsinoe ampelina]|uniref:Uncharacterized protein n=1 Tax=Elsinoe ampelina TaxID=302913 RepID=A0A6A6FXW7_9PEZI|nr:hypothetical protein BDZ85DRAFT_124960 [Elsinoe ampelina]